MLLVNTIILLIITGLAHQDAEDRASDIAITVLCIMTKFTCTFSFVIGYLQAVELFPTPLRNMGKGGIRFLANINTIAAPYLMQTGHVHKAYPYVGLAMINFAGAIAGVFIPETRGISLPETEEDVKNLRKEMRYCPTFRKNNVVAAI